MANKGNISAVLRRNLKDGKEYDKLIPRVKCERTTLGQGDTFYTVDSMKTWIEKFTFQTEKLAFSLKGQTLGETVNNIYNFLYHHIQYEADGSLQQLRSPACSWMQRHSGVDCKSYSVFASSILSNLGIKHAIRQVKQPGFFSDQFTHVYVVVPKNQNLKDYKNSATFVLDATKHQNTEGPYLEKVDLPMTKLNHIGLNAPQDERTHKLVENFNRFTQTLLRYGVDLPTVNAIRQKVSDYTSRGIDPKIEIDPDGIVIENVLFPLYFKTQIPFVAVQRSFSAGLKGPGLGSFASLFQDFAGTPAPSTASKNGDLAAGIVDGGLEIAASAVPFGAIIKNILDKIGLASNISNVLKYGLSSWGASTTPEASQKRFAEIGLTWLQAEIASVTPQNIDEKLTLIDGTLTGNANFFEGKLNNHSRAKSTKLANKWVMDECRKLRDDIVKEFGEQLQRKGVAVQRKSVSAKSSEMNFPIMCMTRKGFDLKTDRYWDSTQFSIYTIDKRTLNSWNNQQANGGSTSGGSNSGGSGSGSAGNNYKATGETANLNEGNGSKSNTGLIIGGVALASIPLLFMMKKGSTGSTVPATKKTKK